jgi:protocatechuate 3,4-dioxygenase alpha subunit
MTALPTPSQTVGPFFSIGLCPRTPAHLVPSGQPAATIVTVTGRIVDGDGVPVPDAILEIWRADENGEYATPGDEARENAEGVPAGFARIAVSEQGEFAFSTSKPGSRREPGGPLHAPHLVVLIFMRGLLVHLVTRMYFSDEAANREDEVLKLVPAERRGTLIAVPVPDQADHFRWEVRLQGGPETVFFAT